LVLIRLLKAQIYKKSFIYLLIALIPSILVSVTTSQHQVRVVNSEYKLRAEKYANFHAMNIEKFVGETVGRLEMLSTSIIVQHDNLQDIDKILRETKGKDPRFSGFYWANTTGDIVISTNKITSPVNVSDRPYFQRALHSAQTSISEAHYGRVTGRYIISIATPIVESHRVKGVFVASLRMDEIKKEITRLINGERIIIKDESGKPLIQTGSTSNKYNVNSVIKVSRMPWTITAYVNPNSKKVFWNTFAKNLTISLTIMSILFLLAHYLLLKRKVQKEKEQSELHKLELIGNLAASTAHEIRNPLTGIKGLVKLLSEENQDGSGLGLTVCKRIIDSYGGEIHLNSSPDRGTQVEIILPLAGQ